MKFMLLIYGNDQAAGQASEAETKQVADAYEAFTQSIRQSGSFLDGDPFHPAMSAVTVRAPSGQSEVMEGPAVTGDPQLQAYYKVQADSRDEAIEMASRISGARFGSVEVRQIPEFD
jgi:hypothetical protein